MLLDKDFLASFAFLTTFGQIFALFGGCVSHLQTTEKDKLSFLRSNFAVWNGQTLLLITRAVGVEDRCDPVQACEHHRSPTAL